MGDIEKLSNAATELANHVAAAVRLSNVLTGILKDGDRDDIDVMTRRVILRAAKTEHEEFRERHFRGLVDSLNATVEIADRLYQSEPLAPLPPAVSGGDAPVVQLAEIPETSNAAPVA